MNALEIDAVERLADELRTLQWERFIDAADIRLDSESGHLIFQDVKAAWELSHPLSIFLADAMEKLGFSPSSELSQSERQ